MKFYPGDIVTPIKSISGATHDVFEGRQYVIAGNFVKGQRVVADQYLLTISPKSSTGWVSETFRLVKRDLSLLEKLVYGVE